MVLWGSIIIGVPLFMKFQAEEFPAISWVLGFGFRVPFGGFHFSPVEGKQP